MIHPLKLWAALWLTPLEITVAWWREALKASSIDHDPWADDLLYGIKRKPEEHVQVFDRKNRLVLHQGGKR